MPDMACLHSSEDGGCEEDLKSVDGAWGSLRSASSRPTGAELGSTCWLVPGSGSSSTAGGLGLTSAQQGDSPSQRPRGKRDGRGEAEIDCSNRAALEATSSDAQDSFSRNHCCCT